MATETIKPVSGCLRSITRLSLYLKLGRRYKSRCAVRLTAIKDTDIKGEKVGRKKMVTQPAKGLIKPAEYIKITWIMVVDMFDSIIFYAHLFIVLSGIVMGVLYVSNIL